MQLCAGGTPARSACPDAHRIIQGHPRCSSACPPALSLTLSTATHPPHSHTPRALCGPEDLPVDHSAATDAAHWSRRSGQRADGDRNTRPDIVMPTRKAHEAPPPPVPAGTSDTYRDSAWRVSAATQAAVRPLPVTFVKGLCSYTAKNCRYAFPTKVTFPWRSRSQRSASGTLYNLCVRHTSSNAPLKLCPGVGRRKARAPAQDAQGTPRWRGTLKYPLMTFFSSLPQSSMA